MQTTISITGQISGNHTLHNAIITWQGESKKGMFNSWTITFPTKGLAVKAIRDAYNYLIKENPESKGRIGGISCNKDRTALHYDASTARIIES